MTEKKLSRRDAMKMLGIAVGAAALSGLPSKWNTPELAAGVLPAHARQSAHGHTLAAGADDLAANICQPVTSTVVITPPTLGIPLRYLITLSPGSLTLFPPATPTTGTVLTDGGGNASLIVNIDTSTLNINDVVTITVTWSFQNPSDGSGSDSQVFTNTFNC